MPQGYPAARMSIVEAAPRQIAALQRFSATGLEPTLAHLVEVRASQLNGCAFCLDIHWKDARAAGEEEARLYLLDAWRESPGYDDRERAALALTEAVTLLAPGGVPDATWDAAAALFDEEKLAALLCTIVAINAWNRLQIATKAEPGQYEAGDLARAAGGGTGDDAVAAGAGAPGGGA